MSDYFKERDRDNFDKINLILSSLPEFVSQFVVGISSRTSFLTRLNYVNDIKIFLMYINKYKFRHESLLQITLNDLDSVTAYDFELYIDFLSSYKLDGKQHSCSLSAKERKLCAIRALYKYLYKKDLLVNNSSLKIDMPKLHDKPIIRLNPDETSNMLAAAENPTNFSDRALAYHENTKERDMAIIYLFLGTGIRVSELVGLNRSDFDFNNASFKLTRKGGNQTILYMPSEVIDVLQKYIKWIDNQIDEKTPFGLKITDPDVMFYSIQGKRIGVRAVEILVKKYASSVVPLKKITPHKLRSTFATQLYNDTKNIYVVANVLGHSDVNTTKRHYAEMSEDIKRQAAEITKLVPKKKD